jgi:hypothetical protein
MSNVRRHQYSIDRPMHKPYLFALLAVQLGAFAPVAISATAELPTLSCSFSTEYVLLHRSVTELGESIRWPYPNAVLGGVSGTTDVSVRSSSFVLSFARGRAFDINNKPSHSYGVAWRHMSVPTEPALSRLVSDFGSVLLLREEEASEPQSTEKLFRASLTGVGPGTTTVVYVGRCSHRTASDAMRGNTR